MAEFDESKVINALHPEKAEIGKKYWVSDNLLHLRQHVEKEESSGFLKVLASKKDFDCPQPFKTDYNEWWEFLYPYEEPSEKLMTNKQLAEWLAKGNGQWKWTDYDLTTYFSDFYYLPTFESDVVDDKLIRPWGSEEWIEPTEDIYLRDCKGA